MSKKDEALKLALEALVQALPDMPVHTDWHLEAITALREALAEQPAPGRAHYEDGDVFERISAMKKQPAQRTWVGLTRAERFEIEKAMSKYYDYQHECKTVCLPEFARAIEAKLREKNT